MAGSGAFAEVLEQQQCILATLAKCWDGQRCDIQAVVEVGAETTGIGGLAQVFLGRGDDADVQGMS